jgi:hypothetical protein
LFFESAEPTFDDLSPKKFFRRFPEGEYDIEGITLEGEERESEVWLSHVMPAPAGGIKLNDVSINLEDVDCDEGPVPSVPVGDEGTVTISWDAVMWSHPDLGGKPIVPVTIHNYEVVVERELEVGGEEFTSKFSVILPPGETSMTIPAEFIGSSDEFKYEILAREVSYNQTAVESCFVLDIED